MMYAVSDIHGEYNALMNLLDKIAFGYDDVLYIIGDAIDRGPKCAPLIRWLVETDLNVQYILGNHEEMMIWSLIGDWTDLRLDPDSSFAWFRNGGEETYKALRRLPSDIVAEYQQLIAHAPVFMAPTRSDGNMVLLAHAGISAPENPRRNEDWLAQSRSDLLWGTNWYPENSVPPFDVISGHVPTHVIAEHFQGDIPASQRLTGRLDEIMEWKRKHAIDCGAGFGGNLGCLRLDDWEKFHVPVV